MKPFISVTCGAMASLAMIAVPCMAQDTVLRLGAPSTSEFTFTHVGAVAELGGGRVVIVDGATAEVWLLSADLRQSTMLGRRGSGPGEFLVPSRLVPLPDGRVGVVDLPNNRVTAIGADGVLLADVLVPAGGPCGDHGCPRVSAADTMGFFWALATPSQSTGEGAGAIVFRWGATGGAVTSVQVPFSSGRGERMESGGVVEPALLPYPAVSIWAVRSDGRLALVHPSPYAVELRLPSGNLITQLSLSDKEVRLSDWHKERWKAEQTRPMAAMVHSRGGGSAVRPMATPFQEPKDWPATVPPFGSGAAAFDPLGRLWIARTPSGPETQTVDIIARDFSRHHTLTLPGGSRLLGFGAGSVYMVVSDSLGREAIQEYPLPR
jgi:hypothetical protein